MTNTNDKYFKVKKVMDILDCSERYVYDLIVAGELIAIKMGSQAKRISEKSLNDYIERNKINPEDFFAPENDAMQNQENKDPVPAVMNKPPARSKFMSR